MTPPRFRLTPRSRGWMIAALAGIAMTACSRARCCDPAPLPCPVVVIPATGEDFLGAERTYVRFQIGKGSFDVSEGGAFKGWICSDNSQAAAGIETWVSENFTSLGDNPASLAWSIRQTFTQSEQSNAVCKASYSPGRVVETHAVTSYDANAKPPNDASRRSYTVTQGGAPTAWIYVENGSATSWHEVWLMRSPGFTWPTTSASVTISATRDATAPASFDAWYAAKNATGQIQRHHRVTRTLP